MQKTMYHHEVSSEPQVCNSWMDGSYYKYKFSCSFFSCYFLLMEMGLKDWKLNTLFVHFLLKDWSIKRFKASKLFTLAIRLRQLIETKSRMKPDQANFTDSAFVIFESGDSGALLVLPGPSGSLGPGRPIWKNSLTSLEIFYTHAVADVTDN